MSLGINVLEMTPAEIDFYVEDHTIHIEPNFTGKPISLICGTYGPFRVNKILEVPLWLALDLRRRNKCKILLPQWYSQDYLNNRLDEEKASLETLTRLPYNFFEIWHILTENALEDMENYQNARSIIEELRQIRAIKLNNSFKALKENEMFIQFDMITEFELNSYRKTLGETFKELAKYREQKNKYVKPTVEV